MCSGDSWVSRMSDAGFKISENRLLLSWVPNGFRQTAGGLARRRGNIVTSKRGLLCLNYEQLMAVMASVPTYKSG